jgi:hypothetical protein
VATLARRQTVLRKCREEKSIKAVQVVRRMSGGSQSRLIECDDGKLYVLKTYPNPQGRNVLANEWLGSIIMRGLGIDIPNWSAIKIDLKALDIFPELLMETCEGPLLPSCGLHFGSEFLGGPERHTLDVMPRSCWKRVTNGGELVSAALFDLWANHRDQRQCVFVRRQHEALYHAFCIDNGHLFGGPGWQQLSAPNRLGSVNPAIELLDMASIERAVITFEERIPELITEAIQTMPTDDWYEGDINWLHDSLLMRLESLRELLTEPQNAGTSGNWKDGRRPSSSSRGIH